MKKRARTRPSAPPRSVPAVQRELWARLVVLLAPVLCFGRAVPYAFARSWDDGRFIVDNPDVRQPSWDGLVRMFTTVQFEAYHPLHLLSYWLDVPWVGTAHLQLTATVVHAVSLTLWIAALLLSYELLRRLGAQPWAAVVGTLAFGLHPAQVEVVSWASARKDVLALLFVVASLLVQLSAAGPLSGRAWLSRALYVCALLSKTTALPLPLFALGLDCLVRRRPLRAALLWHLPGLILGAGVSIAVLTIWREHSMVRQTLGDEGQALVRFTQTLGHQLATALWPSRVSPMYGNQTLAAWRLGRTLCFCAYVLACLLALRSRRGLLAAGLLGFAIFLLPASNLVPLYFPLQDRYVSLPLFALGVALAGCGASATEPNARRSVLLDLAAIAVVCAGARTVQYAAEWQSEPRLWGHAVRAQPDADYAYLKLGEVRREAGDFEGAIAAYRGALAVAPLRTLAHAGLFEVVARRDERYANIFPSRARQLAQQYYQRLPNAEKLREFPAQLWAMGYVRSVELPIQALIVYDDMPEGILLQSAQSALRAGRKSLAQFYLHSLKEAPTGEPLASLYKEPYFRVVP
jgi:protein O-mannosyl-transferase